MRRSGGEGKIKKRKVAIFDIDGTIFRSSLLIEVTEALIDQGIFPDVVRMVYARSHRRWLDRKGSYDDYLREVIRAFEGHIAGIRYQDFLRVARSVIKFHRSRVYRYTRSLVRDLKKRGYFLLAISKSPKGIVDLFARNLGFDKVYGLLYETDGRKRYTGNILSFDLMSDKAKILARAIEKENLTLRDSYGVGDSESDIAFLRLVQNPICFNPNSVLYRHAKRAKWKVVVERKDVVYELNGKKE
ncbi:MAG: HAD-IB family hydrolase [Patescibacteria group bacterium]